MNGVNSTLRAKWDNLLISLGGDALKESFISSTEYNVSSCYYVNKGLFTNPNNGQSYFVSKTASSYFRAMKRF